MAVILRPWSQSGWLTPPPKHCFLSSQWQGHCRPFRKNTRGEFFVTDGLLALGSWDTWLLCCLSALVNHLYFEKYQVEEEELRESTYFPFFPACLCHGIESGFKVSLESFWHCQNGPTLRLCYLPLPNSISVLILPTKRLKALLWQATFTHPGTWLRSRKAVNGSLKKIWCQYPKDLSPRLSIPCHLMGEKTFFSDRKFIGF